MIRIPTICSNIKYFYSKFYIDNTFISSTQTGALYYNKAATDNMSLSYSTGSYVDYTFYTKTETDTFLADKLTNIGDIELPGWLDIGTSGYTNSRIRCNADVGGHTGYDELKANGSWGMFLNLQTTYPNGGWMYFKIKNDDYIQLPGSGNKVNIYKDTTISGNSDVGQDQAQTSIKAHVNHIGRTGYVEMEARWPSQGFIHFKTNHTSGDLFFAVKDLLRDKIYMYCGSDIVYVYEDATIAGNLNVGGIMNTTKMNLTNDVWDNFPLAITNTGANWLQGEYIATANQAGCMSKYKTSGSSTYWWSGVWGSNTNGVFFLTYGLTTKDYHLNQMVVLF